MKRIVLLTTAIITGLVVADGAAAFGGRQGPQDHPSFSALDADGDGNVTAAELEALPTARAAERFAAADADGDGKITAAELAASIDAQRNTRNALRAENMITRFDTDKDGAISQAEMEASIGQGRRGGTPGERLLQIADADKDGVISEEEYTIASQLMQQRAGRFDGKRAGRRDLAPFWRN